MVKERTGRIFFAPARALSAAGVVAAFAFAVVINVIAVRHYRRWDLTTAKIHSLSPATVATLESLKEPLDVYVLLGAAEPLLESVRHALQAYRAHTAELRIQFVDPDKDPAQFEDVRRRFRLDPGRAEAGRAVENVAIVVARGERHWFVERSDLLEIESASEARVRPREERALTSAIRAVLSGEKTRVCFTIGHGEPDPSDFGPRGAGALADVLRKDNYEPGTVDLSAANVGGGEPFHDCNVAVVGTIRRPFTASEASRISDYLAHGGSALFALSPVATKEGFVAPNLGVVLAPYGIALDEALVVETDPTAFFAESRGTQFIASVKPHAVTASLAAEGPGHAPPPIVLELVRPVHRVTSPGAANPNELLGTSDHAFAAVHVTEETSWANVPAKESADLPGPLAIAMASERAPEVNVGRISRGRISRVVVVGTSSVLTTRGLADPLAIGSAFFAEGALSWLAARAPVLDIPDRPPVTAGVRLTAESIGEVKRYVLMFIPLTFAFLGVIVGWSRRRTPQRSHERRNRTRPEQDS
jgi:hypothetical protein